MQDWFLLFDGESADGSGTPHYCGRTLDRDIAISHMRKCNLNGYCFGGVQVVRDMEIEWMTENTFLTIQQRYGLHPL